MSSNKYAVGDTVRVIDSTEPEAAGKIGTIVSKGFLFDWIIDIDSFPRHAVDEDEIEPAHAVGDVVEITGWGPSWDGPGTVVGVDAHGYGVKVTDPTRVGYVLPGATEMTGWLPAEYVAAAPSPTEPEPEPAQSPQPIKVGDIVTPSRAYSDLWASLDNLLLTVTEVNDQARWTIGTTCGTGGRTEALWSPEELEVVYRLEM